MDTLILDIGGDIGALVIHTGPQHCEREIEISPGAGSDTPRSHNVVHARHNRARTAYAAVFPSVPAGDYTVWHPDGSPHDTVTVHGGQVSQLQLP